jgi:hypothetical protein
VPSQQRYDAPIAKTLQKSKFLHQWFIKFGSPVALQSVLPPLKALECPLALVERPLHVGFNQTKCSSLQRVCKYKRSKRRKERARVIIATNLALCAVAAY